MRTRVCCSRCGYIEPRQPPTLTKRQREVLKRLCEGYSNVELAAKCGIHRRTVIAHLERLFQKFDVNTRIELACMNAKPSPFVNVAPWEALTPKGKGIARAARRGLENTEIAAELNTTEGVVKNYMRVILEKTGMGSKLELALWMVSVEAKLKSEI